MGILVFVIAIAFSIASAVRVAIWGRHGQARRRLAQIAHLDEIADHAVVTLRGQVRMPDAPLVAPLSGRACVAYEAASHRRALKGVGPFVDEPDPPIMESAMIAFELDVDGRTVHVEGDRAELSLPPAGVVPRRLEREEAFMARHGFERGESRYRSSYETVVEPGTTVTVQGMALVEVDASAGDERGYRDEGPKRIRIVAHAQHPITIGVAR